MKALFTGLVLFVLFGLILVILYPVIQSLRNPHGNPQFSCMNNERQFGAAIAQYADDHDERMPPLSVSVDHKNTWRASIFSYIKLATTYQCRARTKSAINSDGYPVSYAANNCGNGQGAFARPGSKAQSVHNFMAPHDLILLCEVENETGPDFNIEDMVTFGPGKKVLWAGHTGGSCYLLADGHVKWLRPTQTVKLWYRDPTKTLSAGAQSILDDAEKRFAP